ncbi:uncharacterized protein MELLADRAFT_75601 [Melampsora larici-populina 98AG31]|uniref:Uncharacterized protein n=1 Tax=Melampsora larici-populina (strain 98AG31 / pathotype 3-4-7) TaxID=747676 RepID=F4S1F7_MELLP|nr:uncharacterized protein MELLADRAFT_75601 [Melampsora larici-populina 98AG31]EGG01570.1 hypothetical protein MELLADRAFT_75601 [Melampsora larici-populina 98AG31]
MTTMFQTSLNAIEIISCGSTMDDFSREIDCFEYPRLRVLHDVDSSDPSRYDSDEPTGTLPIFRHVRTLVQPIDDGQHFWRWTLEKCTLDRTPTQHWTRHWKPPKLQLLIFTTPRKKNYTILSAKLVATLESHGIRCRYIPGIKPNEILDLDLELNGPVE